MRNLKDIITERLNITNNVICERLVLSKNKPNTEHTLFPKTRGELKEMIKSEIEKNGNKCSLNHIDVCFLNQILMVIYLNGMFLM